AVGCEQIQGFIGPNSWSVTVLFGSSGFLSPKVYPTGNFPVSLAAGDFNGDGRVDIVSANYNDNTVSVLLGLTPSTIGLTSLLNPSTYGQPVTLSATVAPAST